MKLESDPDAKDLALIREILENTVNRDLIGRNLEELERRYGKSADTLIKLTFRSDFRNELEILKEIRKLK